MRTTLKRGIGRGAGADGNGHSVLPPSVLSPVRRYRQPDPARRTVWARLGRALLWLGALILMVVLGLAGGAYLYYNQSVAAVEAHSKDVKAAAKYLDIPPPGAPTIALVVGYDRRLGKEAEINGARSDTIMLLRADPATDSISMMSFPRDLRTEIWCKDQVVAVDRINSAYSTCGAKGTLNTVKHLTGLPINYLITVDFHGFKEIVDNVGGVWVDVDRRYFNKNVGSAGTNFANIDLQPGYQKLNGRKALDYVRYRHTDSDLYRLARQQQFVRAIKEQVSKNFAAWRILRVIGSITRNVEIGQSEGSGSLKKAIKSYALFAYGLPAGHFFQAKIDGLQDFDPFGAEVVAPTESIQAAVHDFTTPDVEAPEKAARVALGLKPKKKAAPPPSRTTISVLNGNGVAGSASNAAYELRQRGYSIVVPPSGELRNAPTFDYFHTRVYYDRTQARSAAAARKVANLFGDADVEQVPIELSNLTDGAMLTIVVGQTFHNTLAPAPVDKTPVKQAPNVRSDPGQSATLLKAVRKRVDFPLLVPSVVEKSSSIDSEVPLRVYALKKNERAVRLTFLSAAGASGYWGIEETAWEDAPVLEHPSFKRNIRGREYSFYYSGVHLHMVVLHENDATYWVVNTLLDSLSNETMIAIAKGLKPLTKR